MCETPNEVFAPTVEYVSTAAAAGTLWWAAVAAEAPVRRAQPDARGCRWWRRTPSARRPIVYHLPEDTSGASG